MPAFDNFEECLDIATFMVTNMEVEKNLLEDPKYDLIFSVENLNDLVLQGIPFRDAYIQMGQSINEGNFSPKRDLNHTLAGSIGNLCNDKLEANMSKLMTDFNFQKVHLAFQKLREM